MSRLRSTDTPSCSRRVVVAPPLACVVDALTRLLPSRGFVAAPIRQWPAAASPWTARSSRKPLRFRRGGRRPRNLPHVEAGVPAVVLIGSGRNVHTGWRQIGVDMARSLARKGSSPRGHLIWAGSEKARNARQPAQILWTGRSSM